MPMPKNSPLNLLEAARNELCITWEDPQLDKRVIRWIEDGMAALDLFAGTEVDYEAPGRGRELLMAYCRYARAESLSDFQDDYRDDLTLFRLHARHALKEAENAAP